MQTAMTCWICRGIAFYLVVVDVGVAYIVAVDGVGLGWVCVFFTIYILIIPPINLHPAQVSGANASQRGELLVWIAARSHTKRKRKHTGHAKYSNVTCGHAMNHDEHEGNEKDAHTTTRLFSRNRSIWREKEKV